MKESQTFGQLPCLPLGLFSLQSLQHHGAALPRPCSRMSLPRGSALAVPAASPCVLVAFFPPSKLALQSLLFPAWVLLAQDHSGREACAHHLSRTRASLICWSSVSGEAATGWFLRNKKQLTRYFYTISIIYPHFYFDLLLSLTVIMSHVAEQ